MKTEQNYNLFWRLRIFSVTDEKLFLGNSYNWFYAPWGQKILTNWIWEIFLIQYLHVTFVIWTYEKHFFFLLMIRLF